MLKKASWWAAALVLLTAMAATAAGPKVGGTLVYGRGGDSAGLGFRV